MQRFKEENPEKYEKVNARIQKRNELRQLRENDPEAFKQEMQNIRENRRQRRQDHMPSVSNDEDLVSN